MIVRNLLLVASVGAWILACANPSTPPGGPPDTTPPRVTKVLPANETVGAKLKEVLFQFNEVISETPKSSSSLAALVFISPKSGDPSVSWRRTALEVKPRKGWKANTVYTVTLGAGVADLRGNSLDSATRLVFSTGGPIPNTVVSGVAFDWLQGRGASRAIIEAIAPDSTTYQTIADSVGRFRLEHVPIGPYVLRSFVDRNSNRTLDRLEAWDTTSTTLTSTAVAEFYTFEHDTVGLRIQEVTVVDSGMKLKVTFDKPPALGQTFIPPQFVLKRADSTAIPITVVLTAPQRTTLDSIQRKNSLDSLNRALAAKDSTPELRAKRDSAVAIAKRDSIARSERTAREAARLAALRLGKTEPAPDTTPPPKMRRPALFTDVFLHLEKPLDPETNYRLTTMNVRNLSNIVKSPTRTFRTPKPAPKDTTPARDGAQPPRKNL